MRSVMSNNQFSTVPSANIQRSSFDRSHGYKTTFNVDKLVPCFVDEALPGDTFNLSMTGFARLATPIFPIMDNMFMETFFFAVPYRLLWDNFQKFCGEQTNPNDSTDFLMPTMTSPDGGYEVGSVFDYMGIPTGVGGLEHSVLPLRAMNLIYNDWFRDENLIDSLPVTTTDSGDKVSDFNLLTRCKKRDYFTSCLPWPQKGDAVNLPLGTRAPVVFPSGSLTSSIVSNGKVPTFSGNGASNQELTYTSDMGLTTAASLNNGTSAHFGNESGLEVNTDAQTGIYTDLTTATAATINELREAFQVQRMYERDARGGTRYIEIIKSHFGVTSPDSRLQRPEYLGGGSSSVNINPVAQTSGTSDATPQGNLSAYGTAGFTNHGFTKSFTEHCVILGFVNVRADLTYQQGLNRMWSRSTRFDLYWPTLAYLGEQAVLNKEIFAEGSNDPEQDEEVFGYQERFAEYRYKPSMITGQLRSTFAQSLDAWHLSQDFSDLPTLSESFIQSNTPLDRCIAVDGTHFIFDSYFNLRCARPMPVYAIPGMIDHF